MIHGVGVDVLSVKRLEPLMRDLNDPFFQVYTPAERAEAEAAAEPLLYYAERFAAKEAVFKAHGFLESTLRAARCSLPPACSTTF